MPRNNRKDLPGHRVSFLAILALFLFFGAPGFPEEPGRFTLAQAVETALANHRSLDNARKAIQEAELTFSAVAKERSPKVSLGYSYTRLGDNIVLKGEDPLDGSPVETPIVQKNSFFLDTSLLMPLYTGGAQRLSEEIARLGIDLSKVRLLQTRNELAFTVKFYYLSVLKEQRTTQFLEKNLERFEAHEALTKKLHSQGLLARNSILEARTETATARQELGEAKARLDASRSSLNLAMGLSLQAPAALEDALQDKGKIPTLEDSLRSAQENNPELAAFLYLKKQAGKSADLERTHYVPKLYLSTHYFRFGNTAALEGTEGLNGNSVLAGMLSLRWSLFDGNQKRDEARIKETQLAQIVNNEALLSDSIALKTQEAISLMKTAGENIELARLAQESAKENVRIMNMRYREQVASSSEMTDTLTDYKRTELGYYSALYAFNMAIAKLEYITGTPLERITSKGEGRSQDG
ncbi:MAG: TolC family protein [Armatimonadetes bacterium]|nr:TolC family protein [Armatimonadota bacterium]